MSRYFNFHFAIKTLGNAQGVETMYDLSFLRCYLRKMRKNFDEKNNIQLFFAKILDISVFIRRHII